MFFNSIQYIIFLPLVLIVYYLTANKYRWLILFAASCFFYMYFIPKYILCLFFLILVDFLTAKKIASSKYQNKRKLLLVLSIISNFGLLYYFKYLHFSFELINYMTVPLFGLNISVTNEILPIGLSFHTFQSVSYVIDVYRKKIPPEKHLGIYSSYVLFFPQMVAGPIERFSTLGDEIKKNQTFKFAFVKTSIPIILLGYFYKMVIADNCGEYVNYVYSNLSSQNNYNVLISVFLFCIQIYADFFGYSLIAQGSARLFGINLIDNFTFPFFSENIVVFWRKWHISLTSWFRDYIYIPLGGNKKTKAKHYFNILIVFALSGLWHGAGLNFLLWGTLHSFAYILTILYLRKNNLKLNTLLNYLFTFILVSFIFVFFRSGDFSESVSILKAIFVQTTKVPFTPISKILVFNILILCLLEYSAEKTGNYRDFISKNSLIKNVVIVSYLIFAILTFSGVDNLPFIYFQF